MSGIWEKLAAIAAVLGAFGALFTYAQGLESDIKRLEVTVQALQNARPTLEFNRWYVFNNNSDKGTRGEEHRLLNVPNDNLKPRLGFEFGDARISSLEIDEKDGFCFLTGVAGSIDSQDRNTRVFVFDGMWHVLTEEDFAVRVGCIKYSNVE